MPHIEPCREAEFSELECRLSGSQVAAYDAAAQLWQDLRNALVIAVAGKAALDGAAAEPNCWCPPALLPGQMERHGRRWLGAGMLACLQLVPSQQQQRAPSVQPRAPRRMCGSPFGPRSSASSSCCGEQAGPGQEAGPALLEGMLKQPHLTAAKHSAS